VHELTLSELRALSCGEKPKFGEQFASEGIASLAGFVQLLRKHPQVTAFVEIKRIAIDHFGREKVLERVLPALDAAIHQCVLISFSLEFLSAARIERAKAHLRQDRSGRIRPVESSDRSSRAAPSREPWLRALWRARAGHRR